MSRRAYPTHWLSVLKWMSEAPEVLELTASPSTPYLPKKNDYNPLRGHCATSHPLYTLLLQRPFDSAHSEPLALLRACLLIFHARNANRACSLGDYERHLCTKHPVKTSPSSSYPAWLAVQYLASERYGARTTLNNLPVRLSPSDFVNALRENAVTLPDSEEAIRRYNELRIFLVSFDDPSRRSDRDHQKEPAPKAPTAPQNPNSNQAPPAGSTSVNRIFKRAERSTSRTTRYIPRPSHQERRRLADLDVPWDEFLNHLELLLLDDEELHNQPKATASAKTRETLRAIHRPAHLIASHDHYLSNTEIAVVLKSALGLVRLCAEPAASVKNQSAISLHLVALCMFFLSRTLHEISDLHIYNSGSAKPLCDLAIRLDESNPDRDCFRVRALDLDYQTPEMPSGGKAHTPSDYVWLPIPPIVSRTARSLVQARSANGKPQEPIKVCNLTSGFKAAFDQLLGRFDPTGRLQEGRLSSTLSSRLCLTTGGDLALSCLILGQVNDLCRAELYYDGVPSRRAAEIYRELTGSIHDFCFPDWVRKRPPIASFIPDEYVGCRYTPKLDVVQQAVSTVRQNAKGIRAWLKKPLEDDASFIKAHNDYTLYLCWWLGYACGIRAVHSPLLRSQAVDESTGMATWSDKDDASHFHTRVIWIPPDLRRELAWYQKHLSRCQKAFRFSAKWKRAPGYFFDDHARPAAVSPKLIQAKTGSFFALPPNSHRRFMKQILRGDAKLRLQSCPPEIIRGAYLGHWVTDQEPWSDLSCLSVESIRKALSTHVPQILDLLGFKRVTK